MLHSRRRPSPFYLGIALLAACTSGDKRFDEQVLTVACGRCVFEMPEAQGCPWAAEIDGKHYLIRGAVPEDHNTHDKDGICNMPRRARVTGVLHDRELVVEHMALLPAEGAPKTPRFTHEDRH